MEDKQQVSETGAKLGFIIHIFVASPIILMYLLFCHQLQLTWPAQFSNILAPGMQSFQNLINLIALSEISRCYF